MQLFSMNPRRLTLAGSAAAASVALASVLLLAPRPAAVQAATILQNFRQTIANGFKLTFDKVHAGDARVDGQVHILFAPDDSGAPRSDDPESWKIASAALDLRVDIDETADEGRAGAHIALASGGESNWAYLEVPKLPADLTDDPTAAFFLSYLRKGVLLDTTGLENLHSQLMPDLDEARAAAAASGARTGASIKVHMSDGGDLKDVLGPEAAAEVESCVAEGHGGMMFNVSAGVHHDADKPQVSSSAAVQIQGFGDEHPAAATFMRLMRGDVDAETLQPILDAIAGAADSATVVEQQPGLFVLTATGLARDADDASTREMLGGAVLKIAYRPDSGVQWAELSNLSGHGGAIRCELSSGPLSAELLDRSQLEKPGVTQISSGFLKGLMGLTEPTNSDESSDK